MQTFLQEEEHYNYRWKRQFLLKNRNLHTYIKAALKTPGTKLPGKHTFSVHDEIPMEFGGCCTYIRGQDLYVVSNNVIVGLKIIN